MKKSLFNIVSILTIALFVASCNDAAKMAKYASLVKSECTPEVLECVANEITATYSLTFPEKYFAKNAVLEVTPVAALLLLLFIKFRVRRFLRTIQ